MSRLSLVTIRAHAKAASAILVALTITVAVTFSVLSALSLGGASKAAIVLLLAMGLMLGVLALTRFGVFVILTLILRSSLDLFKLSGPRAGIAEASVASRALDPSSVLATLFVLVASLWLVSQYRRTRRLPGSSLRRALLVFLSACSLSIVGSGAPGASTVEAMRIASVVLMFVVLEQIAGDTARMRQVLLAVYLSAVPPLTFTAYGLLTGNPRLELKSGFRRILGTFHQSNSFGRYLMLLIVMGVALYPYIERRWRRPLAMILAGCSVCLLLTYALSAFIGAVLGLLVVGFLQSKRMIIGLLVAVGVAFLFSPSLSVRFSKVVDSMGNDPNARSSLDWRLDYWADVLPLANTNVITGIGLAQTQYNTNQAKQPHNDFVRAYVEAGVIGFIAYLYLILTLVAMGSKAIAVVSKATLDRGVVVGFCGCLTSFVAVSIVANVFSNVAVLWYFFAFAALTSAAVRRQNNPPQHL